ncbi:hypothetical protein [uncultured Tateyamaria sp.]|uniref:hypothetical protein n=1 Tax=uncultured Tateyamaria sp. TaxID=455651 RepID=UPI00260CEF09|nr:hypothetical protein [uncultured Tateyamaria sp.]
MALISAVILAGCVSNPLPTVSQRTDDDATLALSCEELTTRNNNITARLQELEAEQKRTTRTRAITNTVVDVGLGAVMGVGMRGGLDGMRAASATVQGINTVRSAEQAQGSLVNVTDTVALAQRSAQLQRAHVEKGC